MGKIVKSLLQVLGIAALTLVIASSSQAGVLSDPHLVGFGSPTWLSGPRDASSPSAPFTFFSPSSQEPAADVYLLDPQIEVNSEARVLVLRDWSVAPHLGQLISTSDTSSPRPSMRPLSVTPTVGRGEEASVWSALDLGRMRRTRGGRTTGGDQPQDPTSPMPEPATVMLLATGLAVVVVTRALGPRAA